MSREMMKHAAPLVIYLHLCQLMSACAPPPGDVATQAEVRTQRAALGPPSQYELLAAESRRLPDGGLQTPGTGSFTTSVSADGQAVVHIPLWVPPARAGFQPELALDYRSSRADGFLGLGWTLAGATAVTRCPKSPARDGVGVWAAALASNAFCLDGARLVPVSASEFRTDPDSSQRVTFDAANNTWTATFRDGSTRAFGKARSSVAHETYEWLLTEARDPAGNEIVYEYGVEGELRSIRYGGNATVGFPPTRSVTFSYERRANRFSHFVDGPIDTTLRLATIEMTAPQGVTGAERTPSVVKRYLLHYSRSAAGYGLRDVLKEVVECDARGVCLAPIEITSTDARPFTDLPVEFDAETEVFSSASGGAIHGVLLADINADGRQDVIYQVPGARAGTWNWQYRLQDSTTTTVRFGNEISLGLAQTSDASPYPVFLDLDGDGLVDMLGPVPGHA